jgi:hypothetical protein
MRQTTGKCETCSGKRRVVVYRWPSSRGPLWLADCPRCGDELVQTCAANVRPDRLAIREEVPTFRSRPPKVADVIRQYDPELADELERENGGAA